MQRIFRKILFPLLTVVSLMFFTLPSYAVCPPGSPCNPTNDSNYVMQPRSGGAALYTSPLSRLNNYNAPGNAANVNPQLQTPAFSSQRSISVRQGALARTTAQIGNTMQATSGVDANGKPYFYTCQGVTGCK